MHQLSCCCEDANQHRMIPDADRFGYRLSHRIELPHAILIQELSRYRNPLSMTLPSNEVAFSLIERPKTLVANSNMPSSTD